MEKGLILALFASVSFAGSAVSVRKAVARAGESFTAMATSIFVGLPLFAIVLFFTGGWDKLLSMSWQAALLLGAVGIIHFVIGRLLAYNSYRLIGANKAMPFIMTSPFYAVIYGFFFLKEAFTVYLALGVLGTFAGAALITTERKSVAKERQAGLLNAEIKGILYALGAALCWGTTPVLIKTAVAEVGSPLVGTFVSYVTAAIVMAFWLLRRQHRQQLVRLPFVAALVPMIISAVFAAAGQLLNYNAFSYSPIGTVTGLLSTQVLFISIFSFVFNRNIEIFSPKVISGMALTVVGTFLLFH